MYSNQQTASQLGASAGNAPMTALESALSMTQGATSHLANQIERLRERLQNVLVPSVPAPAPATGGTLNAVEPPHSPAVNILSELRTHIEVLAAQVSELANRLET